MAVFCLLAAACGSSTSTDVTAPSSSRCQLNVSGPSTTFAASGGSGSLAVTVSRECAWSAASQASWIEITAGREGQGEGTIAFQVRENGDPVTRTGSIAVAEQRVQLAQEAAPCRFDVQWPATSVASEGGQVVVQIATHGACRWTASSQAPWVTIAPLTGTGPAALQVTIAPNLGPLRTGDVVIGGQTIPLTQVGPAAPPSPSPVPSPPPGEPAPPGQPTPPTQPVPTPPTQPVPAPCSFSLAPQTRSFNAEGGAGSVSVSAGAACSWTAVSSAVWVVIVAPGTGTGSGELRYTVLPSTSSSSREATVTIGGVAHLVTQAGVPVASGPTVELDGPVTGLTGTCPAVRFTIRGTPVRTDAATRFDDGTCRDLRNGVRVAVKGVRQADGSIYAREVEFDD